MLSHAISVTTKKRGYVLIQALAFAAIAVIVLGGLVSWSNTNLKATRFVIERETAFHVAEAGVEYYRWHLAHVRTDYQDGTATSGPYIHDYFDKDGNKIGVFTLEIIPPALGSTIVTVRSTGQVDSNPEIERTIEARLAIPSLAKYAVAADDDMRFGEGTEVFGALHSNKGIRFDGLTHNLITSFLEVYDDPDHCERTDRWGQCIDNDDEHAVHTHINPPPGSGANDSWRSAEAPPNPLPARTDVFQVGRQVGVPRYDFDSLTSDIKTYQDTAGKSFGSSGSLGYKVVLRDDDKMAVSVVTSIYSAPNNCSNSQSQTEWGTWSIRRTGNATVYPFPANGLVFFQDNIWVEGEIDGARLTIVAACTTANCPRRSITVNNNLLYNHYDGQDALALIAKDNINVGLYSANVLKIDGALVAKNGRVGRYYYGSSCGSEYIRSAITLFGMMATNERYGFAYTNDTGYHTRNLNYDGNLLYGPPPFFPLAADHYTTISWREL